MAGADAAKLEQLLRDLVTRKQDHRSRGIDRLAAASSTRSIARSFGGPAFLPRTRSSWRRTRISRSLEPSSLRGLTRRRESDRTIRPRRNSIGAF
jgi:hypothetical protein